MKETRICFTRLVAAAAVLPLIALTVLAQARPQEKLSAGFKVGPQTDEIVPKRFIIDPPTIENLGFRWYIEGDNN
ncbi:MAG: hypothetical protein ACYSW3_27595, partial [Planctomycetota bacterium]